MNSQTNFTTYTRHTVFVTSSHEIASALGKRHDTVVRHIERLLADDPGWAHEFDCNVDMMPSDRWYALSAYSDEAGH